MKTHYESLPNQKHPHLVELHYVRPLYETLNTCTTSDDINRLIRGLPSGNNLDLKEKSWLVCLSRANAMLSVSLLSIGSLTGTLIPIREVVQTALLVNASAVVIVHNHPSGQLKPSTLDRQLTRNMARACFLFDIKLLDHLILSSEDYFSFADEDLITEINLTQFFN